MWCEDPHARRELQCNANAQVRRRGKRSSNGNEQHNRGSDWQTGARLEPPGREGHEPADLLGSMGFSTP